MVNIRNAIIDDVYSLSKRLRKQDEDEVIALVGLDNETALLASFCHSDRVFVGEVDGKIICMFGVSKDSNGNGCPWLLGSDEVEKLPITFVRNSRKYIQQFINEYGYLENYRNQPSFADCAVFNGEADWKSSGKPNEPF